MGRSFALRQFFIVSKRARALALPVVLGLAVGGTGIVSQAAAKSLTADPRPHADKRAEIIPVAVFGNDNRRSVPRRFRQLSRGIGLLYNSRARTLCTAFCVAPNVAATAAHCIFGQTESERQPLSEFWFELRNRRPQRQSRIAGASSGIGMQSIVAGTTNLRVRPPIDAANDWALVRLASPICRGHDMKMRAVSLRRLERASQRDRIFQISYHRDYKHWQLAYSSPCAVHTEYRELPRRQVRQEFTNADNLVLHQCDTAGASSGSPLFMQTEDGPMVVGINVGTYVQSRGAVRTSRASRRGSSQTIANTGVAVRAFAHAVPLIAEAHILANGNEIRRLQSRLRQMSHYAGPIDGIYGSMTRAAIRSYERSAGDPDFGLPTWRLLTRLGAEPPSPVRKPRRNQTNARRQLPASWLEQLRSLGMWD